MEFPTGGRRCASAASPRARFVFRQNGQQIQFIVEAFDAFNTPLWGNPNGILGNSSFGRITTATNREMQIGLRYTF